MFIVGTACLDYRVSGVGSNPIKDTSSVSLEKTGVLGRVDMFALPLPFYLIYS